MKLMRFVHGRDGNLFLLMVTWVLLGRHQYSHQHCSAITVTAAPAKTRVQRDEKICRNFLLS